MLKTFLLGAVLITTPAFADQTIRFGGEQAETVFNALESSGLPSQPSPTGGKALLADHIECALSSGQPVCGFSFNGRGHGMTPAGAEVIWNALKNYSSSEKIVGTGFGCLKADGSALRRSQCWIYLVEDWI